MENETAVSRDASMDISSLMTHTAKKETLSEEVKEGVNAPEEKVKEDVNDKNETIQDHLSSFMSSSQKNETHEEVEEETEIQKAMRNKVTGLVQSKEEIERQQKEKYEETHLKHISQMDERDADVEEKKEELLTLADKAKRVLIVRKPENQGEDVLMMNEIDAVTINDDGTVTVPENAVFIIPKPSKEKMEELRRNYEKEKEGKDNEYVEEPIELSAEELSEEKLKEFTERKLNINIVIDRTGLGAGVPFSDIETKTIKESTEVHLTEVENVELETIDVIFDDEDDKDLSFMNDVKKYDISLSKTFMSFPASGFTADMFGMNWAELSDCILDTSSEESDDIINFDKVYKKAVVVYNKMKNVSCGPFKDFEDFLKKFAYVDLPLATYGLYISTQSEEDSLSFTCQRKNCKTHFIKTFKTRSLIDYSSCSNKYLKIIKKLSMASSPKEFREIAENSDVRKVKRIKLPTSGYILEVGPISLYDYLYKMIKVINKAREDNTTMSETEQSLVLFLQVIRAINLPTTNGTYKRITNPFKILEIITNYIPSNEIEMITAIFVGIQEQYGIDFRITDIVCPKCKTVTKESRVTPDEMVFYIRQRLLTTNITLDNFLES